MIDSWLDYSEALVMTLLRVLVLFLGVNRSVSEPHCAGAKCASSKKSEKVLVKCWSPTKTAAWSSAHPRPAKAANKEIFHGRLQPSTSGDKSGH